MVAMLDCQCRQVRFYNRLVALEDGTWLSLDFFVSLISVKYSVSSCMVFAKSSSSVLLVFFVPYIHFNFFAFCMCCIFYLKHDL